MNFNYCPLTGEPFENRESIEVLYNGTKYTLPYNGFSYGATYDEVSDEYDFSTYPLAIKNNGEEVGLIVPVDTPLPITISAGYTETTPTVWEKVGSGGSTPQTELPKITISMTPNKAAEVLNNVNCFNGNGDLVYYDKYGNEIDAETWEDVILFDRGNETKTVIAYGKETEGIYDTDIGHCIISFENATSSNEVNCTYADGIIEITDPTQEASLSLAVSIMSLG